MTTFRSAIRNLQGKVTQYLQITREDLSAGDLTEQASIGHHIIVVDRSGSMYYDIATLKDSLLKVLTVDEFRNENLRVSLLSYSGSGDLTSHFERVPVTEVMETNSTFRRQIDNIRATGLTCISQALEYAGKLALQSTDPSELQVVSLHSDGYANDNSPSLEAKRIDALVQTLSAQGVVCNTIAYNDYADFRMLSSIANGLGGKCVQARDLKGLYGALYDVQAVLAGSRAPALTIEAKDAYLVYHNAELGRLNGSEDDMVIRGVPRTSMGTVYRVVKVDEAAYNKLQDLPSTEPLYLLARAYLQEGRLTEAKGALVSTGDNALLQEHYKALTGPAIAKFCTALDGVIKQRAFAVPETYGLTQNQISVLGLCDILQSNRQHFKVCIPTLSRHYQRRSVKQEVGVRDENGVVVAPSFDTRNKRADGMADLSSIEINRSAATVNMKLQIPVDLVDRTTGAVVEKVAGILLDKLVDFRQYTLVGDGELNTKAIPIQISSKSLFEKLAAHKLVSGTFDFNATYLIDLTPLPLVDLGDFQVDLTATADLIYRAKALSQIFNAINADTKETADYSAEQVEALKEHCLSAALYVNIPTTTPYIKLADAIANGSVDAIVGFDVDIGMPEILTEKKLNSANAVIDRLYSVPGRDAKDSNKLTMADYWSNKTWCHKTLSARVKVTAVDKFQMAIYDDFLSVNPSGASVQILRDLKVAESVCDALAQVISRKLPEKDLRALIATISAAVDKAVDALYHERVSPVVFYLGCTGTLPESMDVPALTGDAFKARYPDSPAKDDATYFEVGDAVLAVTPKVRYVSRSPAS